MSTALKRGKEHPAKVRRDGAAPLPARRSRSEPHECCLGPGLWVALEVRESPLRRTGKHGCCFCGVGHVSTAAAMGLACDVRR